MATFTTVVSGESYDPFAVNVANEIRTACIEHQKTLDDVPVISWNAGEDAHYYNDWRSMQQWCEDNCTSFVNHTAAISNGDSTVTTFTLSTFRQAASLDANGFSRATTYDPDVNNWFNPNDAMYSWGLIEIGDVFTPLIIKELQQAFDILRWTKREIGATIAGKSIKKGDDTQNNFFTNRCALARTNAINEFDGASWGSSGIENRYYMATVYKFEFSPTYTWEIKRQRGTQNYVPYTTDLESEVDVYFKLIAYPAYTFRDIDNFGVGENEIFYHETLAQSNTSPRTLSMIGNFATNPLTDAANASSCTCGVGIECAEGANIQIAEIVEKWDWSYTL